MSPLHLRLFDLDGSVAGQASLADAAPWASVSTLDLRDLGPRLRLWSRRRTIEAARARIAAVECAEPTLTFLGSGDFHHLAALLIERVREPVTVIHLDNHPDWVRLAPRWHCGSWVNRVLALPNVARVVTIGPCSDDLVRPGLKGGNLPALASGRLALVPWRHEPSRVFGAMPDGLGHRYRDGRLVWRNLAERQLDEALDEVVAAIPSSAIWLTIDKDVLPEADVVTNWDQGQMPLAAVVRTIERVVGAKRLVGADVCGEYAPPAFSNALKRVEARLDQPQRLDVAAAQLVRNEAVNVRLARAIAGARA